MLRRGWLLLALIGCGEGGTQQPEPDAGPAAVCDLWTQWGGDPGHSGASCAAGQPMQRTISKAIVDPFAQQQADDNPSHDLLVHYQVPLITGDDVYAMSKAGRYSPCNGVCDSYQRNSQVWLEKGYRWEGGVLVEKWTFTSDWKPAPSQTFEPMFQPALAGDFLYIPGLGGTLFKVDRKTGLAEQRIQPLGPPLDPDLYVAGGVTADARGNLYYTALKLDHYLPYTADATGWLVVVRPDGSSVVRTFQELAVGAPGPAELCPSVFGRNLARPLPPPDDDLGNPTLPPEVRCLSQRPTLNAAPAIAPDGTIYLVSRAHAVDRVAYIIAVSSSLRPRWARSLNQILADGCGILVPYDAASANACRPGARMGVDPSTNTMPSARPADSSSSSPVVLPDGGILYGAFTGYNGSRGHLVKLDAEGNVVATHDFGWDVTPAIWRHTGTYSIVIKNNTYTRADGEQTGPFYLEQLSPGLDTEWRYRLTNTQSCVRGTDGEVTCRDDHPNGFEWCINAPAVDAYGTVYATGEDGNAYAVAQPAPGSDQGVELGRMFLEMAIGAAYSPLALDGQGRIYVLNDGALKVLGR